MRTAAHTLRHSRPQPEASVTAQRARASALQPALKGPLFISGIGKRIHSLTRSPDGIAHSLTTTAPASTARALFAGVRAVNGYSLEEKGLQRRERRQGLGQRGGAVVGDAAAPATQSERRGCEKGAAHPHSPPPNLKSAHKRPQKAISKLALALPLRPPNPSLAMQRQRGSETHRRQSDRRLVRGASTGASAETPVSPMSHELRSGRRRRTHQLRKGGRGRLFRSRVHLNH